jgi:hypothetical protein
MSIPIHAEDGCMIGSSLNQYDEKPWYLCYGSPVEKVVEQCPKHKLFRIERDIKIPFTNRVVGSHVEHREGGSYCKIIEHKNVKYFFRHDVFCDEHKEWIFQ